MIGEKSREKGIVKLRRIYSFCGRNLPAPKREINDLEVAEQSLNRVKQLNLTIPPRGMLQHLRARCLVALQVMFDPGSQCVYGVHVARERASDPM